MEFNGGRLYSWHRGTRLLLAAAAGLPIALFVIAVLSFPGVGGPGLLIGLGGYSFYVWLAANAIFHRQAVCWQFEPDYLYIHHTDQKDYRRDVPIQAIRHIGLRNRRVLEVVIHDEQRHAPEFLELHVGRMRGEDYLDEIERFFELHGRGQCTSIEMGGALHCHFAWESADIFAPEVLGSASITLGPSEELHTPTTERNSYHSVVDFSSLPMTVGDEQFALRNQPLFHVTDPNNRCVFAFRDWTVFHYSGLAIGQLRVEPSQGNRQMLRLQLSNGREITINEPDGKLCLDEEHIADLAFNGRQLRLRAEPPISRTIIVLAVATWTWSWRRGLRFATPPANP